MAGVTQRMMRATQMVSEGFDIDEQGATMEGDAILDDNRRAHDATIPKATQAAYAAPIRDYRAFCLEWAVEVEKKLPLDQVDEAQRSLEEINRTLVTGARVAKFLKTCVVGRTYKQRGRVGGKGKGKTVAPSADTPAAEEVTGELPSVGYKTLEANLCALCSLQKQQMATTGRVINSPRRFPAVIELMTTLKRQESERKKSSFVDRCKDSFLDGYHKTTQVADIMNEGLKRNTAEGLRDRTMNALSHYGLLRGEDARGIHLPDVQHLPLEHREGPTPCDVMVVLLLDGKTNQYGNTQYMGAIRNRNWDECPLGAMAMWLFYRFQLSGETFGAHYDSFPRMDEPSQWYPIWLFPGKKKDAPISADAHAKATKAVLERAGVRQLSKKVTHIFRGSGARMADLLGASETDIRRGGRWDMSSMAQHYLTTLPRETIRVLAGFPSSPGQFWLERDLDPPEELERLVFPHAALWLEKMQYVPEQKRTIAAHGFLNLLLRLRRVLLQDCAFLQQRHPDNLLLKHDIFQSDAYRAYAAQVVQRSKAVKAPMEVQFQQVMPTLHAKMDTISGVLETGVKDIHSVHQQHLRGLREELLPTLSGIDRVQATQMIDQQRIGASLNLLAQSLQLVTEGTFETRLRLPNEVATETSGDDGEQRGQGDAVSMLRQVVHDTHPLLSQSIPAISPQTSSNEISSCPRSLPEIRPATQSTATFLLEANHTTVDMLWKEWTVGVFGRPSIEAMIRRGLQKSESQRKLYSRRKIVIDEVKRLAYMRTEPESVIVAAMDQYMVQHRLSMTKLQDLIKRRAAEGKTMAFWLVE